MEEEIHIEDYGEHRYFNRNSSTTLDDDRIKCEVEFYPEDYEPKPLAVGLDHVASHDEERLSCSYATGVKQELETMTEGVTGEHDSVDDTKTNEHEFSLAPTTASQSLSDQRNSFETSTRDNESSRITGDIGASFGKRIFRCNLCEYKCTYSSRYKLHMLKHTGEKKFICDICQYKCARLSYLKSHMLTHTGEKKFICNLCQQKFSRFGHLKSHISTHTGEKKFFCNICENKFSHSFSLKTHMLTHTGEKRFICDICQHKFSQSSALNRHMLIHSGEKQFVCNICQYKCVQSSTLKRHMKKHDSI